jgi:hypothetical protein
MSQFASKVSVLMIQQVKVDYAALADEHAALKEATRRMKESVMNIEVRRTA